MTPDEMIDDLPKACTIGRKANSKGHNNNWIGYKLHIDTVDGGVPVSVLLTSASVHDSQVAIPLSEMTAFKVTHLHEMMDSAHDAKAIHEHIKAGGRVPIIDPHPRRNAGLKQVRKDEARARRAAGLVLPESRRYRERSAQG